MEKKNTGLKITIVILCLLIVGLTSYIVYDKVLSSDNDKCVEYNISNEDGDDNETDNNIFNKNENNSSFGGEYLHQLSDGAKVYTDYTNNGSYYYKRVESDGSVSTYGYGIYVLNGDNLINKIVFGVDLDHKSIIKSVVSESKYKVKNDSLEYDASATSGQNWIEEKISDQCNIVKEVTSYLYSISKNDENKNNFIYQ